VAEPFLGRARRLAKRQLASIGQTFFVYDPWVGLVSIVVLAVATPRLAIAGTLASVLARLTAQRLGASPRIPRHGARRAERVVFWASHAPPSLP